MPPPRPICWPHEPRSMFRRWPRHRPLVALWSGRFHERWARWSIFAEPAGWLLIFPGGSRAVGEVPAPVGADSAPTDPIQSLNAALRCPAPSDVLTTHLPFSGGWIASISYELGTCFEPAATNSPADRHVTAPLASLAWCPHALVYDHAQDQWWALGDVDALLSDIAASTAADDSHWAMRWCDAPTHPDRADYEARVARARAYIEAGDIFQANITRIIECSFSGSVREVSRCAQHISSPWYGAHLELPDGRAIISMSPELFVELDGASRTLTTRPIKGTWHAQSTAQIEDAVRRLRDSEKDTAELTMIVDLMRNDLGRVCEIGSIRVPDARVIEAHPTIVHGVGEVRGTLRDGLTIGDVLAASFPAGSITGAPKIRAMQIIEDLESSPRGIYCGSIGYISACGKSCFNVAIRTIEMHGERSPGNIGVLQDAIVRYGVGAGIVADSDPALEFEETCHKAAVFDALRAAGETISPLHAEVDAAAVQRCTDRSDQPRTTGARG